MNEKRFYYICDENKDPIRIEDVMEWAAWYEKADRHVGLTEEDGVKVSTVFLSLNHQFGDGPPLLYETMVFGGELDGDTERYCTSEEARVGHQGMVARVRAAKSIDSNAISE